MCLIPDTSISTLLCSTVTSLTRVVCELRQGSVVLNQAQFVAEVEPLKHYRLLN